jgi:hypothetical protein
MFRSFSRATLLIFAALVFAAAGNADPYVIKLTLSPNVYTGDAGGQITLKGFFTTSDSLPFLYSDDVLFGFSATDSPHLGIVAGSVLSSQNFSGRLETFEDIFGGGGYLGPTEIDGPAVTSVVFLRTFIVPPGTPSGTYDYSYGVDVFPPYYLAPMGGTVDFDTSLEIKVVPKPSFYVLLSCAIGVLWLIRRASHR